MKYPVVLTVFVFPAYGSNGKCNEAKDHIDPAKVSIKCLSYIYKPNFHILPSAKPLSNAYRQQNMDFAEMF